MISWISPIPWSGENLYIRKFLSDRETFSVNGEGVGSLWEKEMEQVEERGVEMEEPWEKHENTNNRELLICSVSQ